MDVKITPSGPAITTWMIPVPQESPSLEELVHQLRVAAKRGRFLIQFLKPQLKTSFFKTRKAEWKSIVVALAAPRKRDVRLKLFDSLAHKNPDRLLKQIHRHAAAEQSETDQQISLRCEQARTRMTALLEKMVESKVLSLDTTFCKRRLEIMFLKLEKGINKRKGCKDPVRLHDLRKSVKRLVALTILIGQEMGIKTKSITKNSANFDEKLGTIHDIHDVIEWTQNTQFNKTNKNQALENLNKLLGKTVHSCHTAWMDSKELSHSHKCLIQKMKKVD